MEKINIAEILKYCPKGMELDCTIYDDVEFMDVDTSGDIILRVRNKFRRRLNKYGKEDNIDCAKCVIFPKGKTTWEGFVPPCKFKEGDVVVSNYGDIHLLRTEDSSYCCYRNRLETKLDYLISTNITVARLATEEEKEKLFKAIKANGYKWNAETKTLEKLIKPIFKVGDKIRYKRGNRVKRRIVKINNREEFYYTDDGGRVYFMHQDDWELVPNKFDITTLKPFDKVLVRNKSNEVWTANFYSHYDATSDKPFICVGWSEMNEYRYCIPYDVNKELLGTTNNSEEYGSR